MQYTKQDRNSWLTELSRVLSQGESYNLDGIAVYAFGSYAKTPTGRDIDLLIVYEKQVVALPEALHIRKKIAQQVTAEIGKQPHICLLSTDEKEWQTFVKEENATILIDQAASEGNLTEKSSAGYNLPADGEDETLLSGGTIRISVDVRARVLAISAGCVPILIGIGSLQ